MQKEYVRGNDIAEATVRAWIKKENISDFGMLEMNTATEVEKVVKLVKPTIFANEHIRIELREGDDKYF